jgi:hypothetical protein
VAQYLPYNPQVNQVIPQQPITVAQPTSLNASFNYQYDDGETQRTLITDKQDDATLSKKDQNNMI